MKKLMCGLMLVLGSSAVFGAVKVSEKAPAIMLKDLGGNNHDSAELSGKIVFVNFWATWCAPCLIEFPELNKLAESYKDKDVKVVAINVDRKQDSVDAFLKRMGIKPAALNLWLDPKSTVVEKFDVDAMPSSFVLDGTGVVRYVHVGYDAKDPAKWRTEIDTLLAAAKPK